MNYNKDQKNNSTYNPPMNPYDLDFHRGKKNKIAGKFYIQILDVQSILQLPNKSLTFIIGDAGAS